MKAIIVTVLIFAGTYCQAQTYYCPVSNTAGMITKFDQWFMISDSQVSLKTSFRGKTDSLTYERRPAVNPSIVYFTDGVATTTLTFSEMPGTIKGIRYSHIVSLKPEASPAAGMFYCNKMK